MVLSDIDKDGKLIRYVDNNFKFCMFLFLLLKFLKFWIKFLNIYIKNNIVNILVVNF